jgi:hypothetical protein
MRYGDANSFKFQRLKSLPRKLLLNGKWGCEFIRIAVIEFAAPEALDSMAMRVPFIPETRFGSVLLTVR